MNKLRWGDEVVVNNPSSKFHKCKGKVFNVTHYTSGVNWVLADINIGSKVIRMEFPEGRFLMKVDRW